MYFTTCKHCQAINYQGATQCHNCERQLFERLLYSNTTSSRLLDSNTTSSTPSNSSGYNNIGR